MFLSVQPNDLIILDTIDSTNQFLLHSDYPAGTSCIATKQTAGRGRQGRSWQANAGDSLLFSGLIELSPELLWRNPGLLPLLAGLSVMEALENFRTTLAHSEQPLGNLSIKWPNDIILTRELQEGKLAGILVENHTIDKKIRLVIGVGINWRGMAPKCEPARLSPIPFFSKTTYEPQTIVADLQSCLNQNFKLYYQEQDVLILEKIRAAFYLTNKFYSFNNQNCMVTGLNEDGSLLAKNPQGDIVAILNSE